MNGMIDPIDRIVQFEAKVSLPTVGQADTAPVPFSKWHSG